MHRCIDVSPCRCLCRCTDVCPGICIDSFENCIKIDEQSSEMGSEICPKSIKLVLVGTPKWRQEANMQKRSGNFNSFALLGAFLKKMASKMEDQIEKIDNKCFKI